VTADHAHQNQRIAAAGSDDCTWAQADLGDADQPVPYTLTAKAEALLADEADTTAQPDPEAGS
jgi:hypothetical protein